MNGNSNLEQKIHAALDKVKLILEEKKKSPGKNLEVDAKAQEKNKMLEEENEKLKEQFAFLQKQHESDLETVNALAEQLTVVLGGKDG